MDPSNPGAVGRPATIKRVALVDRPDHLSGLVRHFERAHAVPTALSEQLGAVGRPLDASVEVILPLAGRAEDPGHERQPSPVASDENDAAVRAEGELLWQRGLRRTRAQARCPRRHGRSASRPTDAEKRVEQQAYEHRGKDTHQIALTPAVGAPTRLLDQRLQLGDALLQVAIPSGLGPARRCGHGHGDSSIRMKL
jgi:hypothetical protein